MQRCIVVIGILFALAQAGCFAQERKSTLLPEEVDWNARIVGPTNIEMKQQAYAAAQVLEGRLREVLEDFKSDLDKEAEGKLALSQEAWLAFAKKEAEFIADQYRGGSHQGLAYQCAYMDQLLERISHVKKMKKSYGRP